MKVFFISTSKFTGGAECIGRAVGDLIVRAYDGRLILNAGHKADGPLGNNGVLWLRIPAWIDKVARNPLSIIFFPALSLLSLPSIGFKRIKKAVFYCNDLEAVLFAIPLRLISGGAIIWHVHDIYNVESRATRVVLRLIASQVDELICLTNANAERMSKLFSVHATVVSNFCRLPPPQCGGRSGYDANKPRLGYLGQITPWKGVETAIALLRHLNAQGKEASLFIAGTALYADDAVYEKQLKESSQGLPACWLGQVQDVVGFLEGIDFLVVPSKNEPFGLVIIEALSQGVPVIAWSGDGPNELVNRDVGLLMTTPHVSEVALQLEKIDSTEYAHMSRNAIEKIKVSYTRDSFISAVVKVLDALELPRSDGRVAA